MNLVKFLLDKKLYKNILVYDISYKTFTSPKPLRIRFDKIDRFNIVLDGKIKHLRLLDYELVKQICDKIKYIIIKTVVLQIVLIIILERSGLIHLILYLLRKHWLFIML